MLLLEENIFHFKITVKMIIPEIKRVNYLLEYFQYWLDTLCYSSSRNKYSTLMSQIKHSVKGEYL